MAFVKKYHFILFFGAWTLLNFCQAANTVLMSDEAYYWVYSRFLDWGYFDHPPMIALLIKAGYFIFHNELGVRLFIVIFNASTLLIIYRLLPRKNDVLFYSIASSIALLQMGGFIAVPDIPLIFFVALFFLQYKKFIERSTLLNAIVIGIIMALMVYSKYHGVLVIVFTLLSNIKLLKNGKAYVAVLVSILLFTPHLYWQYEHGFPSVQYNFVERNASSYNTSFTLEYIGGQILLAGPLMGWLFLFCAFKYKPVDVFERSLQFCMAGVYLFFLLSTFKGRVEANWTVPAMVPLIILSHQYLLDKIKWKRILNYSVPVSLFLILVIRTILFTNYSPIKISKLNEFLQDKKWAQKISEKSQGLPVVFINSYQKAAKYWFYGGVPAFSLNTPDYRRNNYNFWPIEKSLQGKPVYAITQNDPDFVLDSIQTSTDLFKGRKIDSFYSYSRVQLGIHNNFALNDRNFLVGSISINNEVDDWNIADTTTGKLFIQIFNEKTRVGLYELKCEQPINSLKKINVSTTVPVLLPVGKYIARFGISSCLPQYSSLNSTNTTITIEN